MSFAYHFVQIEAWVNCAGTGVKPTYWQGVLIHDDESRRANINTNTSEAAVIAHCGDIGSVAPSFGLMTLLALSQSLPALCFGLIFALPALKQCRAVLANKMSSVMPTTSMSSSVSE